MNNQELVNSLIKTGYLKTPEIIQAFLDIDRKDFVLKEDRNDAYQNHPLPIGYGQTISQPATVAFLLELLQPKPGQKILDIGSGSGWQTALLANIVGEKGEIFAIERIPELAEFSKKNIKKYFNKGIKEEILELICGDGSEGLPNNKPFDRIIAAAEFQEIPDILRKQLKEDGRMVLPVKQSVCLITKKEVQEFPGFIFVPLIKNKKE